MKKFEFNEHGVCINPDLVYSLTTKWSRFPVVEIYVAKLKDLWINGGSFHTIHECAAFGCFDNSKGFQKREEAVLDAFQSIINSIRKPENIKIKNLVQKALQLRLEPKLF